MIKENIVKKREYIMVGIILIIAITAVSVIMLSKRTSRNANRSIIQTFTSIEEAKKEVPQDLYFQPPKYLPEGVHLKQVRYVHDRYVKELRTLTFIYTYKDAGELELFINPPNDMTVISEKESPNVDTYNTGSEKDRSVKETSITKQEYVLRACLRYNTSVGEESTSDNAELTKIIKSMEKV